MLLSTPNRILKALKRISIGRTVPELAAAVGASVSTTRRSVSRLMLRGQVNCVNETRKCSKTNQKLHGYGLTA